MKKILFASLLATALTACVSDNDLQPVEKYGYISVNVNNDPVMAETRAIVTVEDLSAWTIKLKEVNGSSESDATATFTSSTKKFTVEAGTYKVYASSHASKAASYTANNKYGEAYYEGNTDNITISAGDSKDASIVCGTAKNARIKAVFPTSIITVCAIKLTHKTATSGDDYREGGLTLSDNSTIAYYEPGAALSYELTYNYNDSPVSTPVTGDITLGTEAQESVIQVKTNDNGTITVSVTKDDAFTPGGTTEVTIDAATGNKV